MPMITFSEKDIKRSTIVVPAWYRVKIETVGEEPAKAAEGKGPSMNYPVEGIILFNGDNGDPTFEGVPINWMFNSKAIGFAVPFLKSFGVEIQAGQRFDLKAAENLILDVFVENGSFNNRLKNEVNHKYRAPLQNVTRAELTPLVTFNSPATNEQK